MPEANYLFSMRLADVSSADDLCRVLEERVEEIADAEESGEHLGEISGILHAHRRVNEDLWNNEGVIAAAKKLLDITNAMR